MKEVGVRIRRFQDNRMKVDPLIKIDKKLNETQTHNSSNSQTAYSEKNNGRNSFNQKNQDSYRRF